MHLTSQQVKKVAKLADLKISEDELEKYTKQFSDILDYIDHLNTVDTTQVESTFNVTGLQNVMAEDAVSESLSQDAALSNSNQVKNGYFVTKGVFEEE